MNDQAGGSIGERSRPVTLGVSFKQYLDIAAAAQWAGSAAQITRMHPAVASGQVRVFVLPSLPAVKAVREALGDAPIAVGAQDLHWEDRGPFTGGVSGADLAALGCTLVEVGHAERRRVFGEGDEVTRRKFAAALRNGLTPVLCVGEREEVDADAAAAECVAQLESAFEGIRVPEGCEVIVAYEPEWAIGRTEPAGAAHVSAVTAAISAWLAAKEGLQATVLYGGSAKPGTLGELEGAVDGLFLGRFAHRPGDFASIIDEAAALA